MRTVINTNKEKNGTEEMQGVLCPVEATTTVFHKAECGMWCKVAKDENYKASTSMD